MSAAEVTVEDLRPDRRCVRIAVSTVKPGQRGLIERRLIESYIHHSSEAWGDGVRFYVDPDERTIALVTVRSVVG